MKYSKMAFLLGALSIGILIYFVVNNERMEIGRGTMMGTGETITYHPTISNFAGNVWEMSQRQFEQWKRQETFNIIKKGWWAPALFFLFGIILMINENKNAPVKRLEKLRTNSIINEEEFNKKILENELLIKNSVKEKQFKNLVKELDPLKKKGLLTEEEYQNKIDLIREKIGYSG